MSEGNTWPEQEVVEKWWRENSLALKKALTKLRLPDEPYPEGWARVTLMISPDATDIHAIGGDREAGEGDTEYVGLKRLHKWKLKWKMGQIAGGLE